MSTPKPPGAWWAPLREAWQTLAEHNTADTAQLKTQYEATKAETALSYDVRRAKLLAQYHAQGVSEKDLAACIEVGQQYVSRLLIYGRFMAFVCNTPAGVLIPEFRFRRYWTQMVNLKPFKGTPKDSAVIESREAARAAEEHRVFTQIIEWVQAGKPPLARPKAVMAKTPEQLRPENRQWKSNLRKEVNRIYHTEIQPEAKALRSLMRADRSQWAPTVIASRADRLERGMNNLLKSLREHQVIDDHDVADQT
jgi:hypothetical protein